MNEPIRNLGRMCRRLRAGALGLLTLAVMWGGLFYAMRWNGLRLLRQEDSQRALQWFQAASFLWPRSAENAICKASAARRAGHLDLFEKYTREARRLGCPHAKLAWEQDLFDAQSGRMHQVSSLAGIRSIEEHVRHVIASRSEFEFPAREALSKGLIQSFRLPEAEAELSAWIERAPGSFVARLWLGQILIRVRQYPRAIQNLIVALELKPHSSAAQFGLAQALHASGRSAEALPHLQKSLKERSQDAEALALIARCFQDQGELAKAREFATRAHRLAARDASNLAILAQLDLAEDRLTEALQWARLAVEAGPRERIPNHVLAEVLARLGKVEEATAARQVVQEIRKDWEDFEEAQDQVLREPLNPGPRLAIGLVLARNLNSQQAIRWILSALAIDPDHVASHNALADLYRQLGDLETAERHQQRARQLTAGIKETSAGVP